MLIVSVGLVSFSTPVALHYLNLMFFRTYEPAFRTIPYLLTNLFARSGAFTSVYVVEFFPAQTFLTFAGMSASVLLLGLGKQS